MRVFRAVLLMLSLASAGYAAHPSPRLVKDIFPANLGSNPANWANSGSRIFFSCDDGVHGTELWVSDGTPAGTHIVDDFAPGSGSLSTLNYLCSSETYGFFTLPVVGGNMLYRTDGTQAGTVSLGQLFVPEEAIDFSGKTYIAANTSLLETDGTAAGTSTIYSGSGICSELTVLGDIMVFCYTESVFLTPCLYKSDGTPANTTSIVPNTVVSHPRLLTVVGSKLFFSGKNSANGEELWATDGTAAGTALVKDIFSGSGSSSISAIGALNGLCIFSASDGATGQELWVSDGTSAGTQLLKDIWVGTNSSSPEGFVECGGVLYFHATDGYTGRELWRTDGTEAGTYLVKDIAVVGDSIASGSKMAALGGAIYFRARPASSGETGYELWRSDGTSGGTVMLKDLYSGAGSGCLGNPFVVNGHVVMPGAMGLYGSEVGFSDGTEAGTLLFDINKTLNASSHSGIRAMMAYGDKLLFSATDGPHGIEPFISDGTEAGTFMLKDVNPGINGSAVAFSATLDGIAYASSVRAYSPTPLPGSHFGLWKTDGTPEGTEQVFACETTEDIAEYNGNIYFAGHPSATELELMKSDGTPGGTILVKDINTTPGYGSEPWGFAKYNSLLYFFTDWEFSNNIYRTDGTDAGTFALTNPGTGSLVKMYPSTNALYYVEDIHTGTATYKLWKTNGSTAGSLVVDSPLWSLPEVLGDKILFAMGNSGPTLWKADSQSTVSISDAGWPKNLTRVGNKVFFFASMGLWCTDGTASGTHFVKEGVNTLYPEERLYDVNGVAYFMSSGDIWRSDGTSQGTYVVVDDLTFKLPPEYELCPVGNTLYFPADDGIHGYELWALDTTLTEVETDWRNYK